MNKRCKCCRNDKPLDAFGPSSRTRDGRLGVCRACLAARKSKERATPPEVRQARRDLRDEQMADAWARMHDAE
ncbi:hypothetical protein [Pseudomonas phage Persinger]|uniref:HNH endonuclease n=1 Tax=Pseudomonas phage Persinger TaxID=2749430 RepID=A0A7D7JFS9_9CAUD|nr:hypothetical protein KB682_gp40 [Pseudomonas phage Persinger]QMP19190.1 hypothetical protein [Pseudomonas phage Persinger]